jgi:hypothetical protein
MIYSIHIGCNNVDPSAYPPLEPRGWHLPASVKSARAMQAFVLAKYPAAQTTLLIRRPTVAIVKAKLAEIASVANPGDLVIFTYCGHGAWMTTNFAALAGAPDSAIAPDLGSDRNFELTILLWDRMMPANEFGRALTAFRDGVRFFNVIDGCNLGTFYLEFLSLSAKSSLSPTSVRAAGRARRAPIPMGIEEELFRKLYERNAALYDSVSGDPGPLPVIGINFGACKDGETAFQEADGSSSYFTGSVLNVMRGADPPATYTQLAAAVAQQLLITTTADGGTPMHPPIMPFGRGKAADLARAPFT